MRFNISQWGVIHGLGWVVCLTDGWLIHNYFLFGVGLFFIVYSLERMGMRTEEDDEFERIQREASMKGASQTSRTPEQEHDNNLRNKTLEEVAKEFEKMPFGDTAASFAIFVRGMKR
jgi:hypothetical protein